MSSHCIAVNRAPKRTGTRVECNNIATTNRDTRRGRGGVLAAAVVICLDRFMRAEIFGKRAK